MQDILDRKYPPIDDDSDNEDSEDSDEDEEHVPAQVNSNYNKAKDELLWYESWKKKKKYRPKIDTSENQILTLFAFACP